MVKDMYADILLEAVASLDLSAQAGWTMPQLLDSCGIAFDTPKNMSRKRGGFEMSVALTSLGWHKRGPRNKPLWYPPETERV